MLRIFSRNITIWRHNRKHLRLARCFSVQTGLPAGPSLSPPLLLVSKQNGVFTLKMNNPTKLNAWTGSMLSSLKDELSGAAVDPDCKVVVLTGEGSYYCAGVSLSDTLKPMHPRKLRTFLIQSNAQLFEMFLSFQKPILVAINGPAIGASVTSATLCDSIFATQSATFSTPFAALGITPEGCSSVIFERRYGAEAANRLLTQNWRPTATEALQIGLVQRVFPSAETMMLAAQAEGEKWILAGHVRSLIADGSLSELRAVNAKESIALANAFLAPPFLNAQITFLFKKGKYAAAAVFFILRVTRPVWKMLV